VQEKNFVGVSGEVGMIWNIHREYTCFVRVSMGYQKNDSQIDVDVQVMIAEGREV
jgi:hypothetical protein